MLTQLAVDWKRLLLADGPRQSINALILYSFVYANGFETSDIPAYWDNSIITAMLLFSMIATVLIFAGSLVLLVAAAVLYVPLLCYIQGNLKAGLSLTGQTRLTQDIQEYVCHKVDKVSPDLANVNLPLIMSSAYPSSSSANNAIASGRTRRSRRSSPREVPRTHKASSFRVWFPNQHYRTSHLMRKTIGAASGRWRQANLMTPGSTQVLVSLRHQIVSGGIELTYVAPSGSLDVYKAYGQHPPQLGYEQPYQSGGLQYSAEEYGR